MPPVSPTAFATKLAHLVIVQESAEAPEFEDFDRLMAMTDPHLVEQINAVREHVATSISPIFDNSTSQIDAVLACFMYGVLIGQKLARYGVTGVAA